jgi:hypothetical protein
MTRLAVPCLTLIAFVFVSNSSRIQAGPPGCRCSNDSTNHDHGSVSSNGSELHHHGETALNCECACVVPSCCGIGGVGGGLVHLGSLYGTSGIYGYHESPHPRSFESGFENLPNMDGYGVHHRLPFHSYRRPWAHPGVVDNNINIVW